MGVTITQELLDFQSALNGKLDGLNSCIEKITTGLTAVNNATTSASSSFDQYYKSNNKTTIMNSFSKIQNICEKINTSVSSDLKGIVSDASSLLTNIDELDKLKNLIDEANNTISREEAKDEPDRVALSNARSTVYNNTTKFNTLLNEATTLLANLKSRDAELSFVEEFTQTSLEALKENLKFGTFELKKFHSSNGYTISYYLYVPDYGEPVEGLPINMFMHGSGMGSNSLARLTEAGLGKYIAEKKITPSGLVVIPLAPTGRTYESKSFRNALAELPLAVADEYHADKTKISLSGHSYGSITAYRLVNEHPGEFSAIVPISGSNKVTSAFKGVSVWAFHGTLDRKTNNTSYSQAVAKMKEIKAEGGTAVMHAYDGGNHGYADTTPGSRKNIVEETFTKEHEINGEKINPLEWAFQQTTELSA